MDWENERYVRVYTRDTRDMLAIGWQGRALLVELMRKCDRAGCLDIDDAETLSELLRMPTDVVEPALAKLVSRGVVEVRDGVLVLPNFIEAQEAKQSDRLRQRESRARRRDKARGHNVTNRDDSSQCAVTGRDAMSQAVTGGHSASQPVTPSLAVPSLAVPCSAEPSESETRARVYGPATMRLGQLGGYSSLPDDARQTLLANAEAALALWDEAEKARAELGLQPFPATALRLSAIAERLAEGHTLEQCQAVIANATAEVRADARKAQYFAPAIWELRNFERRLAGRGLVSAGPLEDACGKLTSDGWDEIMRRAREHDRASGLAVDADAIDTTAREGQ